jgi:hypothetical protein
MLSKLKEHIFLIDGLGALLSALLLVFISFYESIFGMPANIVHSLIPIPFIFSLYTLVCHFIQSTRWKILLKIIASANMLYCGLTLYLVYHYFASLTIIGLSYFILETVVILILSIFELKLSRN